MAAKRVGARSKDVFGVMLSWTLKLNLSNRHREVEIPSRWVKASGIFQLHHFLPLFLSKTKQNMFCSGKASI